MLNELLEALGPQFCVGHGLHVGWVLKCEGEKDGDGNPINQHVIGVLTKAADEGAEVIAVGNDNSAAVFELDPDQKSFDPTNPVCYCGKAAKV